MKAKVLKAIKIKDGSETRVLYPGTVIEVDREQSGDVRQNVIPEK